MLSEGWDMVVRRTFYDTLLSIFTTNQGVLNRVLSRTVPFSYLSRVFFLLASPPYLVVLPAVHTSSVFPHTRYPIRAHPWDRPPPKMFFSREGELRAFMALAERGIGPALLATLEDGRVEQFLEGRVSPSAD